MTADVLKLIAQVRDAGGRLWLEDGQVRYAAPAGALPAELLSQMRAHKAEIAAILGTAPLARNRITPIGRDQRLPLSGEELFFFDPSNKNRTGFPIMRTCVRLSGSWSPDILKRALLMLVEQNEILRTAFVRDAEGDRRVIAPAACFAVAEIDARAMTEDRLHAAMAVQAIADNAVLDVSRPPLLRASLFLRPEGELLLHLTAHHITYDGGGWAILVNRLFALYVFLLDGMQAPDAELVQYADYAWHQRQWLQSAAGTPLLSYWQDKCRDLPEPLMLKFGEEGDAPVSRQTVELDIAMEDVHVLAETAGQAGGSLFLAVLALLNLTLALRSGARDIVIGSPFMTRDFLNQESMLGCLVDQLVFRQQIDLDRSFLDLLRDVRNESLSAYGQVPMPSDLVAASVGLSFDEFHRRAYSVMLVNQSSLPGLNAESIALAKRDLHIGLYAPPALAAGIEAGMPPVGQGQPVLSMIWTQLEKDRAAKGVLTYFRGRAPAAHAGLEEMRACFYTLLRAVCRFPQVRLSELVSR